MLIFAIALIASDPQCHDTSARCRFLTIDADWAKYAAIEIAPSAAPANGRASMSSIKDKLNAKRAERDRLVAAYELFALDGDDEWSVAAHCRIAETLLEYARALRGAKDPPALADNPEGLDLFRSELENQAFPVAAHGVDELQKTAQLAEAKHISSPYAKRCNAQLATLTKNRR